jgi:hypothetical protein
MQVAGGGPEYPGPLMRHTVESSRSLSYLDKVKALAAGMT